MCPSLSTIVKCAAICNVFAIHSYACAWCIICCSTYRTLQAMKSSLKIQLTISILKTVQIIPHIQHQTRHNENTIIDWKQKGIKSILNDSSLFTSLFDIKSVLN